MTNPVAGYATTLEIMGMIVSGSCSETTLKRICNFSSELCGGASAEFVRSACEDIPAFLRKALYSSLR